MPLKLYKAFSPQRPLLPSSRCGKTAPCDEKFFLHYLGIYAILDRQSTRRCSSMAECQLPKLNTRVRFPSLAPYEDNKKDIVRESPDFIGVFCCPNTGISRCIFVDIKRLFCFANRFELPYNRITASNGRQVAKNLSAVFAFNCPKFCKRLRAFCSPDMGGL